MAQYAHLPEEEKAGFETTARLEQRLGKRARGLGQGPTARDGRALWGMSDDRNPVRPDIIHAHLAEAHPDRIPGFTTLAQELRERTCRAAFFRDSGIIPKDINQWGISLVGRVCFGGVGGVGGGEPISFWIVTFWSGRGSKFNDLRDPHPTECVS